MPIVGVGNGITTICHTDVSLHAGQWSRSYAGCL